MKKLIILLVIVQFFPDFIGIQLNAQPGTVISHTKISDSLGNFSGILDNSDVFGQSVTPIGDLDGDGITDIAEAQCYQREQKNRF